MQEEVCGRRHGQPDLLDLAVTMNSYVVNFKDPAARALALDADGFELPEDEWGHAVFYTGNEKDPTIVCTVDFGSILSIAVKPSQ